ncbi:amino acid adenylation domain-containing protein [Streptomyces sp. NPDC001127]|uniref:amino acid adenylation domain-containing protein n=1 Tax=Streptomyces sp. NPDC001127 TaxID=3154377 RepID=UPI003325D5D8
MTRTDTLHARFTNIAAAHPDRIAVSDASGALTYRELAGLSDEVAAALQPFTSGPGNMVALRASRSRQAVVGILGILKSGAAYLPIDPAYPVTRQDYLLSDSGVDVVLTDTDLMAGERQLVSIGDLTLAQRSIARGARVPEGTAYTIYTSGSSGAPKGCLVGHEHVLALMDSLTVEFTPRLDDVWSVFHSWSFDFSVWELWGALLHGGQAFVVDKEIAADPGSFGELLRDQRITVLNQVPSVFSNLVTEADRNGLHLPDLRHVIFGGEAMVPEDVRRWWAARIAPQASVNNTYGITETTVFVTNCVVTSDVLDARVPDKEASSGTPIGKPLEHLNITLRDEAGKPVPIGCPGEIWVSGASVAYGYLGRETLTAERFVQEPESGSEGHKRFYKSGDLAVADSAGNLYYIGRNDSQVKLGGYRIELGEIEAVLRTATGVLAAGCLIEEATPGGIKVLTACVVPDGTAPETPRLRQHLARNLPTYMLPQRFRIVPRLPVTAHGKIDRQALAQEK